MADLWIPGPEREPVNIDELLDQENDERYLALREANRSLLDQVARLRHSKTEFVMAAYRGARDAAASLIIPDPGGPREDRRDGSEEWCVPLLSDTQIGKLTATYDSSVCAERVDRYADKILRLAEIQRHDHPVRNAHVAMLGDMVEGEDIFPGQRWEIHSSLFRQVMKDGPEIFVPFLLKLLGRGGFDQVRVDCIDGNHGRIGKKGEHHPQTNMDRFLYTFIKELFAKEPRFRDRIRFRTGDDLPEHESNWYRIGEIGNYRFLQIHGWEIKGNGPWHGMTLKDKVNGWASGGLGRDISFLDVFMGHWHQVGMVPLNHRKVYVNGSTESSNPFAMHHLSAQSEPKQWLLFVDPEGGRVSSSYDVSLW